jgi:hypothetical protein
MEVIQNALVQYRYAFDRLPCPANATIAINLVNFGVEAANPGSCTGGVPAANFLLTPAVDARDAREGMVPTKTLQLPDDYAFDGWGRRFMYAVSADYTAPGAFIFISAQDTSQRMTILNQEGGAKSTIACEVLVSFGPNGHGAYPRNGGATRINASSVNVNELNNCDCNNTASASTGFDGVFVQQDLALNPANARDGFDDLVYFTGPPDYILAGTLFSQPFTRSAAGGGAGNGGGGGGGAGLGGGGSCPPGCSSTVTNGVTACLCGN